MSVNKQASKFLSPSSKLQTQPSDKPSLNSVGMRKQSSDLLNKGLASSDSKTTLGSIRTPLKRVKLRDYLFIAETSVARNNEKRKTVKQTSAKNSENPQETQVKKKAKYQISNQELYKIVRKQILAECTQITKNLCSKMEMLRQQNESAAQDEELLMLYEIQRIINDKMKPAMKEMNKVYYHHQKTVAQQMFALGRSLHGDQFGLEKQRSADASQQSSAYSSQVFGHQN